MMKHENIYQSALASVNLYGYITMHDFTTLIRHYFPEQTETISDLREIVAEIQPKNGFFSLQDDLILCQVLVEAEDLLEELIKKKQDKPHYYPPTVTAFLKYADEYYFRPTVEYKRVHEFFSKIDPDPDVLEELLSRIRFDQQFSYTIENTFRTIVEENFLPPTKEEQDEMIDLLIAMDATARKLEHNGYSLWELEQMK